MCVDKHSRHDGRDTADNAQQSGQFPQICCTEMENNTSASAVILNTTKKLFKWFPKCIYLLKGKNI